MATTDGTSGGRAASIVLWVLQGLAAAMFLFTAFGKFTGSEISVETFDAIGAGDWLRYLVGVLELLGAIGLLIPRLCGLAALCLALLLIGAVITQIFVVGGAFVLPLALLAVVVIIAWGRRARLVELRELLPGSS